MNFIKLKIFVGILLIHLIDQICCETGKLEDKYETGKEALLSITINHDNVKNFFTKFHKEYNHSSNIFKDKNDKSIVDFIDLSKKRIFMEVNNLAQKLNKLSLDEQLKYEKFIRANIEIYKMNVKFFNDCFKNNNLLNKILGCIDHSQNTNSNTNKAYNEDYNNTKNLLDTYNSLLIPKIKLAEKNFITTTNEIIFFAKNNNDYLIKKKTSTSIPSTSSTNKKNRNLMYSGPHVNDTLKNIYIKQKNIINTANLEEFVAIQSIIVNTTLDHILKVNNIINNDRKNVQCCFDYSKGQLDRVKFIAVNDSDKCVEVELLNLKNLSFSQNKEAEKYFSTCFKDNSETEDIFECIGWLQSSNYALKNLKLSYNEAVNKFTRNQEFLTSRIFDCLYKSRDYFNQRLKHLNNQFDNCIQHQKSSDKCIEPTSDNFMLITLPPNTQIIELDFVTVKP